MKLNRFLDFIERITIDPCDGMGLISTIGYMKAMNDQPAWKTIRDWLTPLWYPRLMGLTVCKWKGCDWVDESYGGPDSGCMAGHCERCGYGFHHTLY